MKEDTQTEAEIMLIWSKEAADSLSLDNEEAAMAVESVDKAMELVLDYYPDAVCDSYNGMHFAWENAYELSREEGDGGPYPDHSIALISVESSEGEFVDPHTKLLAEFAENLANELSEFQRIREEHMQRVLGGDFDQERADHVIDDVTQAFLQGVAMVANHIQLLKDSDASSWDGVLIVEAVCKAFGICSCFLGLNEDEDEC